MGVHLHSLSVQGHLSINELIGQLVLDLSILVRDTLSNIRVPVHTTRVQLNNI